MKRVAFPSAQRCVYALVAVVVCAVSTSCVPLLVGAAIGYIAHDEGFMKAPPVNQEYTPSPPPDASYQDPVY